MQKATDFFENGLACPLDTGLNVVENDVTPSGLGGGGSLLLVLFLFMVP